MPGKNYDVRAKLAVDGSKAYRSVGQVNDRLAETSSRVRALQNPLAGMFSKLVAIGGAYLGLSTITRTFAGLTRSAVKYTAELEATQIGLTSVISAVDNLPWDDAAKEATAAFKKINELSIESPATPAQMFDTFKMILGPVRAAGFEMNKVFDLTSDTMLAAAALGVDYEQASRDIGMMATGVAGADVKMFRLLRSTGAITEETEQWNKNLTGQQRIEKLGVALKKFAGSGKAFGRSWAGVTSTFQGITDEFKRNTFTPIMASIGSALGRFNDSLLKHRIDLEKQFGYMGGGFARVVDNTLGRIDFDKWIVRVQTVANRIGHMASSLGGFMGRVVDSWDKITDKLEKALPMLKLAAGALAGYKVAGMLGAGGAGGAFAGAAGGGGGETTTRPGKLRRLMAFGDAAAIGHYGGLAGSAASPFAKNASAKMSPSAWVAMAALFPPAAIGLLTRAAISAYSGEEVIQAEGGGGGGGGGGSAVGKLAGVAAGIGAVLVVAEHWDRVNAALAPQIASTEQATTQLALASAEAGEPLLKTVGMFEVLAKGAWVSTLGPVFNTLQRSLAGILDHVGIWAERLNYQLAPAFDFVIAKMGAFATSLELMLSPIAKFLQVERIGYAGDDSLSDRFDRQAAADAMAGPMLATGASAQKFDTPKARRGAPVTNVDARGARVQIKQSFQDTDPDRLITVMMQDLERQAESRISSAFSGALTR